MRPWIKRKNLGAVVPQNLIESTVAAAMRCHDRRGGRGFESRRRKSPGSRRAAIAVARSLSSSGLLPLIPRPLDREVMSGPE
jgi:hypothetical protein